MTHETYTPVNTTHSENSLAEYALQQCMLSKTADAATITNDINVLLNTDTTNNAVHDMHMLSRQTKILDAAFMRLLARGINDCYTPDPAILSAALQSQKYARHNIQSMHVLRTDITDKKNRDTKLKNTKTINDYNDLGGCYDGYDD